VMTHGAEVPNSAGIGGGLPGGLIAQRFTPASGQETNLGPKPGSFPITPADLFEVTWQGGGGLGDPLDRDPRDVLGDVRYGLVSRLEALETYGVVLAEDEESFDRAATAAARRGSRAARLGVDPGSLSDPVPVSDEPIEGAVRLADRLIAVRDEASGEWEVRTLDGTVLCVGSTRWRAGAHRFAPTLPPTAGATLHPELTVTGWADPATGALLAIDVHQRDTEPFHDIDLEPIWRRP